MSATSTDPAYDRAIAYAADLGATDGRAAATWYFDGNTPASAYAAVLAGIADGDPAVLDTFPSADLSGQWADSLTGFQLAADAFGLAREDAAVSIDPDVDSALEDICDAYESAFSTAVEDEIGRVARYQTEDAR